MTDDLEIMLKSHECLREEILNSINWQNRFVIAIVPIISALLGLGLADEKTLKLLLVAIPPAVIVFAAFWLTEQSRMMRAGDYIQLLEDEINHKVGEASISWENWLRIGMTRGAHRIHYISQYLGVMGILYILSGFSIWKTITDCLLPLWVPIIYILMLIFMAFLIIPIVRHQPRERAEFKYWRQVYLNERVKKGKTSAELKQKLEEWSELTYKRKKK